MRVLIVDDEPLARAALTKILESRRDVERFDAANDAIEAQEFLSKEVYDVMLLDISMPQLSGLELLERLQNNDRQVPSVVLVTAYAQHAVDAFEKHAVDYVLKPFTSERISQALEFAYQRTASERAAKLMELMPYLRDLPKAKSSKIAVKSNGRILFLDPHEVIAVQAEGNYVLFQKEGGSHLLRESISSIEERLEPYGFLRIHRSFLVNSEFVQEIRPCDTGEYRLRLKGGREYTVTRKYRRNLKSLARFWLGTEAFPT